MRLLIIGSMSAHLAEASKIALQNGAKITHVESINQGLEALRATGADMVMVLVDLDVRALVQACKSERITVEIVACGIRNDSAAAVKAIKAGAKEYIPLPPDAELIAAVLQAVSDSSSPLLFADENMAQIIQMADQIAPSEATVLITGESGTGKEVMARYLHEKSKRKSGAFISINCAAIPENLLESELFGHEKGAFTGAISTRLGKFEQANGGTLLLDEISEMDLRLQAKLLRAIQEREIDRVGGNQPIKVNIRLLATSNRDLGAYVRQGHFREDLYYRLNVMTLELPPLRMRPKDIAKLSSHFVEKYCAVNDLPLKTLDESALAKLQAHSWQGNVRELENTIHRSVLLTSGGVISADKIFLLDAKGKTEQTDKTATESQPVHFDTGSADGDAKTGLLASTMAMVERNVIMGTMDRCLGDNSHAASILGISIRALQKKLIDYQIQAPNLSGYPPTSPPTSFSDRRG